MDSFLKKFKSTKFWLFLKKIRNEHRRKANYSKAKRMPLYKYEEYLIERTYEMMLRKEISRPYAYKINFENPRTFTEKRQWIKLYDQDPRKALYTDKYEVRKHIEEVLGDKYLIPLISVDGKDYFESVKDIDFSKLPDSFVIKCTHGSHMNIIVKNNYSLTRHQIKGYKRLLNKWLHTNYAYVVAAELQYKDLKPRLIIEKYVEFDKSVLTDYKFFCFHGIPKFVGIFENRWSSSYMETYVDMNFNPLDYRLDGFKNNDSIQKPKTFEKMVEIAKLLCEDFSMVRVDLYTNDNQIFFGELTFSSAAGYDFPNPFKYDEILGDLIVIDPVKRENDRRYRR